jgi:anti-sigma-K factor RskA
VSIGLIDSARRARFQTASLPARAEQLYEITLEPATGSPIGRPTGPVLMKGLAATPRL